MKGKVNVIGWMSKKFDMKEIREGLQVIDFVVAFKEKKDEPYSELTFSAFGGQAKFLNEFVNEGDLIDIEASVKNQRINDESYDRRLKLYVNNLTMLKRKEDNASKSGGKSPF